MDVVDLISDSDEENVPPARVERFASAGSTSRREGKRPVGREARDAAAPSHRHKGPEHDAIDLEAATGVGLGVSGKPLLPGELEARQQWARNTWTLTASRSTEDTPEEQHYRFAESAWCRGGGQAAEIGAIEYHFHPALEARWHAKKVEYDERFGVGGHTILFAFHGTGKHNVRPILEDGFKVSKVGSSTDPGFYGAGIYFSEQLAMSRAYNRDNDGMFLCKLLVGKPFLLTRVQNGCSLQPGYTSHVNNPQGTEVVIFDDAAMIPIYRVRLGLRHQIEPLKGLGGGGSRQPVGEAAAGTVGAAGAWMGFGGGAGGAPKMWHATAERSKNSRAKCKKCGEAIMKGSLRMGDKSWRHLACYKRPPLTRLGMPAEASQIDGFGNLDANGQAQLKAWFAGGDALKRLLSGSAKEGSAGTTAAAKPSYGSKATAPTAKGDKVAAAKAKLAAQLAAESAGTAGVVGSTSTGSAVKVSPFMTVLCDEEDDEDAELQEALARSMMDCDAPPHAPPHPEAASSDDEDDLPVLSLAERLKAKQYEKAILVD